MCKLELQVAGWAPKVRLNLLSFRSRCSSHSTSQLSKSTALKPAAQPAVHYAQHELFKLVPIRFGPVCVCKRSESRRHQRLSF
jgi:hypothetical protein